MSEAVPQKTKVLTGRQINVLKCRATSAANAVIADGSHCRKVKMSDAARSSSPMMRSSMSMWFYASI